jgi:hypothetical protein
MIRWATSGFGLVDKETYSRRWNACLECPHLTDSPNSKIYGIVNLLSNERRICSLCGCVAKQKARLVTESCPSISPFDMLLTRWSEPKKESN